jgi:hypothetical protein
VTFRYQFPDDTELTGPMLLHLNLSVTGTVTSSYACCLVRTRCVLTVTAHARQWRDGSSGAGDEPVEAGGIVVDEAEQGRPAGVLPGQTEEVQAGDVGGAALMGHFAVVSHA